MKEKTSKRMKTVETRVNKKETETEKITPLNSFRKKSQGLSVKAFLKYLWGYSERLVKINERLC